MSSKCDHKQHIISESRNTNLISTYSVHTKSITVFLFVYVFETLKCVKAA